MTNKHMSILVIINLIFTIFIASYLINMSLDNSVSNCDTCTNNKIDIVGTVMSINKANDGIVMLVEDKDKISEYDKAYVKVSKKAMIIKTIYSRTFTPEEIYVGDKVKVEFVGPVAESYPVQADAGFVWIIESEVQ